MEEGRGEGLNDVTSRSGKIKGISDYCREVTLAITRDMKQRNEEDEVGARGTD